MLVDLRFPYFLSKHRVCKAPTRPLWTNPPTLWTNPPLFGCATKLQLALDKLTQNHKKTLWFLSHLQNTCTTCSIKHWNRSYHEHRTFSGTPGLVVNTNVDQFQLPTLCLSFKEYHTMSAWWPCGWEHAAPKRWRHCVSRLRNITSKHTSKENKNVDQFNYSVAYIVSPV